MCWPTSSRRSRVLRHRDEGRGWRICNAVRVDRHNLDVPPVCVQARGAARSSQTREAATARPKLDSDRP
jgi:hypothetical protein